MNYSRLAIVGELREEKTPMQLHQCASSFNRLGSHNWVKNFMKLHLEPRYFCSSDQEKLLKFEAEGHEFEIFLRSLEQFVQTVKDQNNLW